MLLSRRVLRRLGAFRASRLGGARWVQREPSPPRCPPGWSVGPPDFIGVGAQKAGTTWWFHLISAHPQVYHDPAQRPELHFWDQFSHRWPTDEDIARYHRLFPRPPDAKTGEKTPSYMADYWVPTMLNLAAPQAKIIVLLRDPIERYRSSTAHFTGKGRARDRITESGTFERGLYAGQLARLYEVFGEDRMLVLQYERCVADPARDIALTYSFLGLRPYTLSEATLSRKRNVAPVDKAEVEPHRLVVLRAAYEPDVRQLRSLVPDLDLSLWPNFAQLD